MTFGYIKWGIIDSKTEKIIEECFSKEVAEISLRSIEKRRETTGLYVVQIIKTLEDKGTAFPGLPKSKKVPTGVPPDNAATTEQLKELQAYFNRGGKDPGSVPMVTTIRGKNPGQPPPGWDGKDDGHHRSPVPAK